MTTEKTPPSTSVHSIVMRRCPFCGGLPKTTEGTGHVRVMCSNRECNGHPATSWGADDECIARWNQRVFDLEEVRSAIIKIAAACARFQHLYVNELEQDDLPQFGDFANRLKKIADSLV